MLHLQMERVPPWGAPTDRIENCSVQSASLQARKLVFTYVLNCFGQLCMRVRVCEVTIVAQ